MFLFTSPLFWYKILFMFELLMSEILFTFKLRKRNRFALRASGAIGICFVAALLFPMYYYNAIYSSVMFFTLFAVTLPLLKLCYNEPWKNLIFCAIAAYTVKHFAFSAESLMLIALGIGEIGALGAYGSEISAIVQSPWEIMFYVASYGVVYWLAYVFFGSKINKKEDLKIDNFRLTAFSGSMILVNIVLNAVAVYYGIENYSALYITVIHSYNLLCCLFALLLQFGLLNRQKLKNEIAIISQLRYHEQEQYRIAKGNIDMINLKCHDLKHFVRRIGEQSALDKATIREIENAISIYDASVQTSNETLDILLTEKSLFCQQNSIKLSCVADGKQLEFMTTTDIYSLFGNAIENAVESVLKIQDPDKRIIGIVVRSSGQFLSIHVDNYFTGKFTFANDLPVTTKKNTSYHGYGLKSIKYIVEKYDGDMSIFTEDDVFNLNILFPMTAAMQG